MKLFRYSADKLPVAIFALYTLLDLWMFFWADSILFLLLWFAVGILPKACMAAWNHHHQHLMTFRQPVLNRGLELIYAFHTGITSHLWVLHHVVGHHLDYLDQSKDASRWKRKDGSRMGNIEYSFSVMLTAYPRAFALGRRYPKHLPTFLGMSTLVLLLLIAAFMFSPVNAFWVFLAPMTTSLFLTAQATYKHHSGLDTQNEFEASTNIMHRVYNIATGNLGYHTAHHHKCGVHWSKIPQLHAKIAHKIPPACYMEATWPWTWLGSEAPEGATP